MLRKEFWDDYEHIDKNIEYMVENVLQTSHNSGDFNKLESEFSSSLQYPWTCSDCKDPMKDCFKYCNNYTLEDELILRDENQELIYECNSNCQCDPTKCLNRLVQFGPRGGLKIQEYSKKGFGLTTESFIPKGAFICEYAGELLTKSEADHRNRTRSKTENYLMCLNERPLFNSSNIGVQTFIDPTYKGNIGRYINHSCDPNCRIVSVRVESPVPRVGIFVARDVEPEEELCFHYGDSDGCTTSSLSPCYCEAKNCKGFLPNLSYS